MTEHYEIEIYVGANGEKPFSDWLRELKDLGAKAKIRVRLDRVRLGNFGDCESVGEGVGELKFHFGPGYRVYFGKSDNLCILLLLGGSKKTQVKDIKKAKEFWRDYLSRGKSDGKK